jgi:hypothetical protein
MGSPAAAVYSGHLKKTEIRRMASPRIVRRSLFFRAAAGLLVLNLPGLEGRPEPGE